MCNTEKIMKQLELQNKVRKTWLINPKTRVKPEKKYNRQQEKQIIKKLIKNTKEWID